MKLKLDYISIKYQITNIHLNEFLIDHFIKYIIMRQI